MPDQTKAQNMRCAQLLLTPASPMPTLEQLMTCAWCKVPHTSHPLSSGCRSDREVTTPPTQKIGRLLGHKVCPQ